MGRMELRLPLHHTLRKNRRSRVAASLRSFQPMVWSIVLRNQCCPLHRMTSLSCLCMEGWTPSTCLLPGPMPGSNRQQISFRLRSRRGGIRQTLWRIACRSGQQSLFKNFVFPVLLREDPRYFRRDQGTFGRRFGYAITRVVVTRRDSRAMSLNFSRLFGSLVSSAIANVYYPASDRGAGSTFTRVGIAFGTDAGFNVISEFGPDFARKILPKSRVN